MVLAVVLALAPALALAARAASVEGDRDQRPLHGPRVLAMALATEPAIGAVALALAWLEWLQLLGRAAARARLLLATLLLACLAGLAGVVEPVIRALALAADPAAGAVAVVLASLEFLRARLLRWERLLADRRLQTLALALATDPAGGALAVVLVKLLPALALALALDTDVEGPLGHASGEQAEPLIDNLRDGPRRWAPLLQLAGLAGLAGVVEAVIRALALAADPAAGAIAAVLARMLLALAQRNPRRQRLIPLIAAAGLAAAALASCFQDCLHVWPRCPPKLLLLGGPVAAIGPQPSFFLPLASSFIEFRVRLLPWLLPGRLLPGRLVRRLPLRWRAPQQNEPSRLALTMASALPLALAMVADPTFGPTPAVWAKLVLLWWQRLA